MRRRLLFSILLLTLTQVSNKLQAQECGVTSGPSVCAPDNNLTIVGFSPSYDSLPCVVDGIYYDTVVQFHAPSSDMGYTVSSIQVTSITNIPCGMCWAMGNSNNTVNGGQSGCIRVSGTTFDQPGQYKLLVYATITVSVPIIGSVTVGPLNIDSLTGLKYFARVRLPGGPCIPVDTLAAGNQASIAGSITTPAISGNTSFCPGNSTTLTAGGGNYYGYVWSTGALTSSITVTTSGTYTVTVYDNCNSATASQTVTATTGPAITITPATTSVCPGASLTLTANGANSYVWSNAQHTSSITVQPSGTTTYTVTGTATGNCTGSASRTISIYTPPTPHITATSDTICGGTSTTLTASGGVSYAWNNSINIAINTVSPASTSTYTVTVTDANTCTASLSNTVTVNRVPVTISGNGPTTLCTGGSITLTTDTTFVAYHWSTGAATRTLYVTTAGTYTVSVTGTNGCQGVSNSVNITVGNNLSPTIVADPGLNICPGGSAALDAGAGFTSYAWSNSASTESITVSTAGTYTVTVSAGACSGSASAQVSVGDFPVSVSVTEVGPVTACAGDTIALYAGAGYSSYLWSNGESGDLIYADTSGSYSVVVTKNFCTGSDTVQVTFNPRPAPVISPAGPLTECSGDTVILDAGAGFASYSWSDSTNNETTRALSNGVYSVTVTQNGCTGSATPVSITFNSVPAPAITPSGNQVVCTGQQLTLDAGPGYASYVWSNGASTQAIVADSSSSYSVTVTQNGCSGSSLHPTVVSANTAPAATLQDIGSADGYALLQAGPAGASYTWLWQQSPNGYYSSTPAQGLSDTVACSAGAAYYRVVVTQNGCSDTSAQVVVVCTGINDIPSLVSFSLHPNPANDVLYIDYGLNEFTQVKISVFDITGRKMMGEAGEAENEGKHEQQLSLNELAPGIYFLSLSYNHQVFVQRFVKQ